MTFVEQAKEIIDKFYKGIEARQLDLLETIFAENIHFNGIGCTTQVIGWERVKLIIEENWKQEPPCTISLTKNQLLVDSKNLIVFYVEGIKVAEEVTEFNATITILREKDKYQILQINTRNWNEHEEIDVLYDLEEKFILFSKLTNALAWTYNLYTKEIIQTKSSKRLF